MRNNSRIIKPLIYTDIQLLTLRLIGIYFHSNISLHNIDKFIDLWDWSEIINRYYDDASLYTIDFLEKYVDRIPTNNLQNSYLWYSIVKRRMKELAFEIVSQ